MFRRVREEAERDVRNQLLRILFIGKPGWESALRSELEGAGYQLESAVAATEWELTHNLQYTWDVAIARHGGNEFGATEALRVLGKQNAEIPLIVVSGRVRDSDVAALLEAGAADHLTRWQLWRLSAVVARELQGARLRRERKALEEQFHQSQKMEAAGRLAGGVAHDFNNLLTVITGYSDLLLANPDLAESQRKAVEEIRRAAERGGALTQQLLSFGRRQPMRARVLALNELVMNIQSLIRRLIGEDVSLVIIPAALQDKVSADPGRIEQVIMNLVVNARDAMPDGGTLTIETANVELAGAFEAGQYGLAEGTYIALSIADTGTGMDKQTLQHAFEPFFTTKRAGRGTGLGLATAYAIIRQSGGAVHISSSPGEGTVARILLPAVEVAEPATPAHEEKGHAVSLSGSETILLVEDEPRVRRVICEVLDSRGYRVLEAARGEEAVRLAETHTGPIDLLLVDVVMPEMSGPETVRQLLSRRPGARVLYMSGYTDEAILHHGISEGEQHFLPKPFLPVVLVSKVREVLDKPRKDSGNES